MGVLTTDCRGPQAVVSFTMFPIATVEGGVIGTTGGIKMALYEL
jgi:hypothetical protein